MDPSTFDGVVQRLSGPLSRRSVMGAALLAALGLGEDAAAKKHRGHTDAKKKGHSTKAKAEGQLGNGARCDPPKNKHGKKHGCNECRTGFSVAYTNGDGQTVRKCACKPVGVGASSNQAWQCCSGLSDGSACVSPPVTATTQPGACASGQQLCQGRCIPSSACCTDGDCAGGRLCLSATCQCRPNFRECQGACIPGSECCGDGECTGGMTCQAGTCRCPSGQHECGGNCIPNGTCCNDADCNAGSECIGSQCIVQQGTCPAGYQRCTSGSLECNGNPNCVCAETRTGGVRCWAFSAGTSACSATTCNNDADCASFAPGSFCVSCCGNPVTYACAFPCPS